MKKLNRDERFIIRVEYYIFFLLGVYTLMVGVMIPHIREEFGISYELSGYLVSANSVGVIVMNLIASYTAIYFGLKRAYMVQHAFVIVGLVIVTLTGNPLLLILGMAFVGFSRGSTSIYSNAIVNDITKSDTGLMNLVGALFAVGACVAPFFMIFSAGTAGNWRFANYGVSVAAVVGIVLTFYMKFGNATLVTGEEKRGDMTFFKRKRYWITLIALFCYSGVEISIIGWIVTFFIEVHETTTQFASAMATLLWVAQLVGRFACSWISNRTTAAKFILYLSIGTAAFLLLFVGNIGLGLQIAATIGLGLFMSGIYSTILASAGPIFSEYKLAFGYFFMISGLGPVIMPAVVGLISERHGILTGVRALAVVAVALPVIAYLNTRLDKNKEEPV